MDLTELSRRLENLVRIGTVHSIDHEAVRCRVKSGELITQWLPWHTPRAGATRTWDPPTIGEQAVVLSPSGEPAGGVVFYGLNSDAIQPPSHSADDHVTEYPDGARIAYNHASGHLSASGVKTAHLQAETSVTLDTPLTHATGDLNVDGKLTYNTAIGGNLSSNGIVLHTHTHHGTGGPQ